MAFINGNVETDALLEIFVYLMQIEHKNLIILLIFK